MHEIYKMLSWSVGDALKTGLEKNSYDMVHERLVLINLPTAFQQESLAEMVSL